MNLAAISKTVQLLLPIIAETIQTVEAIQGSGNGNYKKAVAVGVIESIYSVTNPTIPFSALKATVERYITDLVGACNAAKVLIDNGVFIKNPAAVPVAA